MNCLSRLTVANLKLVALLDVKHNRSDSSYLPREMMNRGSSLLFLFHRSSNTFVGGGKEQIWPHSQTKFEVNVNVNAVVS